MVGCAFAFAKEMCDFENARHERETIGLFVNSVLEQTALKLAMSIGLYR